jgi:hypothetical protein
MNKQANDDIVRFLHAMSSEEVLRFMLNEIRSPVQGLYQTSLLLRDETERLSTEDIPALYNTLVVFSERLNNTMDALAQFMVLKREEQSKE